MSANQRSKDDADFRNACDAAGIPPSAAQYSKYRRHFGVAYSLVKGCPIGSKVHEISGLEFSDQRAKGNVVPQEYGPYSKTPKAWPKDKNPRKPVNQLALLAAAALIMVATAARKQEAKDET